MIPSNRKNMNLIFLLILFLFAEYLRVIGDSVIERSADNLLFCVIAMIWAVYLKRRIVDKRTQQVLIGLAISLVILFVVRTCKYVLFDKNTILWYMYYIPLTMMPLLVFLMSKGIGGKQKSYTYKFDSYYLIGLVLINAMILTNDYHQFVFRFTVPGDIDTYTYGIGYFITLAWIVLFTVLGLFKLYRVCSLPQSRSKIWVPLIPMLLGTGAIILDILHMVPMVYNTKIYLFQEIVLLMIISIVECCIYIGIIPSNDGYEEIFANSSIHACITDLSDKIVYSSDENLRIHESRKFHGKNQKAMLDDYTRLHASNINGGVLYYSENIQEIVRLNHMLEEASEVISAENEVIEAENQLLADEVLYKTKIKLYDDIARIVRPQVLMIEDCLAKCEQEPELFKIYMVKATVLNAYIKRRINLSLIAMEQQEISLTELNLAIAESFVYLNNCMISTSILNNIGNESIYSGECIKGYDVFEELVEAYYGNMNACMVTIDKKENQILLRMTLETTVGSRLLPKHLEQYKIFEDDDTLSVSISLMEGGDT